MRLHRSITFAHAGGSRTCCYDFRHQALLLWARWHYAESMVASASPHRICLRGLPSNTLALFVLTNAIVDVLAGTKPIRRLRSRRFLARARAGA